MVMSRVRDEPYKTNGSGSDGLSAGHEANKGAYSSYASPVDQRKGEGEGEGEGEGARVLAQLSSGQEPSMGSERADRAGESTLDEETVEVLIELQGAKQVRWAFTIINARPPPNRHPSTPQRPTPPQPTPSPPPLLRPVASGSSSLPSSWRR